MPGGGQQPGVRLLGLHPRPHRRDRVAGGGGAAEQVDAGFLAAERLGGRPVASSRATGGPAPGRRCPAAARRSCCAGSPAGRPGTPAPALTPCSAAPADRERCTGAAASGGAGDGLLGGEPGLGGGEGDHHGARRAQPLAHQETRGLTVF